MLEPEGSVPDWWSRPFSVLAASKLSSVRSEVTISEAVQRMKEEGISQLPVVDGCGCVRVCLMLKGW